MRAVCLLLLLFVGVVHGGLLNNTITDGESSWDLRGPETDKEALDITVTVIGSDPENRTATIRVGIITLWSNGINMASGVSLGLTTRSLWCDNQTDSSASCLVLPFRDSDELFPRNNVPYFETGSRRLMVPFENSDSVDGANYCPNSATVLTEFCSSRIACEAFAETGTYPERFAQAIADPSLNVPAPVTITNIVKTRRVVDRLRRFTLDFDIENVPNDLFERAGDQPGDWSLGFNDGHAVTLSWALWYTTSPSTGCEASVNKFSTTPVASVQAPYLNADRTDTFNGAFVQLETFADIPTTSPTTASPVTSPTSAVTQSQDTSSAWETVLIVVGVLGALGLVGFALWKFEVPPFRYSKVGF
jgi:hypothetical protein